MKWDEYLELLRSKYADKPDDFKLSIGHWETQQTAIPGVELPEFCAYLCVTVGELKAL